MKFIYKIILTAITALVLANFLPGIEVYSFESALVLAIVLGFLNTFLKPTLIIIDTSYNSFKFGAFSISFKCNNCFYNVLFC